MLDICVDTITVWGSAHGTPGHESCHSPTAMYITLQWSTTVTITTISSPLGVTCTPEPTWDGPIVNRFAVTIFQRDEFELNLFQYWRSVIIRSVHCVAPTSEKT